MTNTPTTPIFNAEELIATAIRETLKVIAPPATGSSMPRVFWTQAPQDPATGKVPPLPFIVAQLQAPITPTAWVGGVGATALIAVKAMHTSQAEARRLSAQAAWEMLNLPDKAPAGLTITQKYIETPPSGVPTTAINVFRVTIEKET